CACQQPPARAKFARTCFRVAISPMLKPKEIHHPKFRSIKGDVPMSYSAEISRSNPTCFIFLLDQSGSMADGFGEGAIRKADFVADVVNRTLHDLVIRCSKMEEIRNYYHISIVGYGESVGPVFSGSLSGRYHVPVGEVADMPARLENRTKKVQDGAGGIVE